MRPLTLAALTPTALTAVVAHADVTYASGATLDGSVVCTNNFSSVGSVNAILSGYDSSGSGFVGGSFSDPIYTGWPAPTFSLYSSTGGLECSGAMSGTYADGQVTASFSGTCTDGSLFSGTTVQQIATVQHYEGGGRVGRRLVTSYLITSGNTVVN